uniref:SPATA6 domain-containing protein n=1 Tax=Steinernema glaseri TaxID=37863 RepID=A0A1I7ZGY4_9BILA
MLTQKGLPKGVSTAIKLLHKQFQLCSLSTGSDSFLFYLLRRVLVLVEVEEVGRFPDVRDTLRSNYDLNLLVGEFALPGEFFQLSPGVSTAIELLHKQFQLCSLSTGSDSFLSKLLRRVVPVEVEEVETLQQQPGIPPYRSIDPRNLQAVHVWRGALCTSIWAL